MLEKLKSFATGYGTYGIGAASVVYGVAGYLAGGLDHEAASRAILDGLGLLFLRRAVGK